MKFHEYLENEFTLANIASQKEYHPTYKGKTMAITDIVSTHKTLLKWKWTFVLLFTYVKCLLTGKFPEKFDLAGYMKEQAASKVKALDNSKETECQSASQVVS